MINLLKIWRKRINTISGTVAGGKKAALTNKLRHGADFYAQIGKKGGKNGHTGGFASMTPEQVKACGAKGGAISKRGKAKVLEK